jgi:hypothetical protein
MTHPSEEQMVDGFYDKGREELNAHLAQCEECRVRFRQLEEVLNGVSEYPVPERDESYGKEVWARLAPMLPVTKPRRKWLWMWTLAPAMAALLVVAFLAGIWTEKRKSNSPENSRERVLLLAMSEHLERSQIVLTQLLHDRASSADLGQEQVRARNLLAENRLLRQTALHLGDRSHAALLDDLERVLIDLANSSPETDSKDFQLWQRRVQDDGLLWKIRVTSTNAREKGQKL